MTRALLANNAATTLAAATTTTATTLYVASTAGFPQPFGGEYFFCTLLDITNKPEIVRVTAVTVNTMTCTRAQEGTVPLAFAAGSKVSVNITAGVIAELADLAAFEEFKTATTTALSGAATAATAQTQGLSALLVSVYPIGSIYTNASVATNPATLIGFGTWTQFGAGRVLLGVGGDFGAGTTGGSNDAVVVSHSHTATTVINDPGHTHGIPQANQVGGGSTGICGSNVVTLETIRTTKTLTGISAVTTNTATGVSGTNANLQPYVVVYMWLRTA